MNRRVAALWLGLLPTAAGAEAPALRVDPAEIPVGTLAIVRVADAGARGTFDGEPLRFFVAGADGVALLGVDLDRSPGRYPLRVETSSGGVVRREVRIVGRDFPIERLTVPKTYTEPDPETQRRIQREQAKLAALWGQGRPERTWEGRFIRPTDGPAGSPFGLRRFFNGEPRSPHAGIDFKSPTGTPVHASNRGVVALAEELFFTGNIVVLDHGLGLFTLYIHLSEISVRPGEMVDRGAGVGKVGATGRVTGPHLHFAARIGEARIDPETLLDRAID